jgi:deoxyribodipyrimidine photo-lyase
VTRAIHWFRRDLSVEDNIAWSAATQVHDQVLPLYVLDRRLVAGAGPVRRGLLFECLAQLDAELRGLGGRLTVLTGDPVETVTRVAAEHEATSVVWNEDVTGYSRARDAAARAALATSGVAVDTNWSLFVHPPGSIVTRAGAVPLVFGSFHRRWAQLPIPGRATRGTADVLAVAGEELPEPDLESRQPVGAAAARARLAAFIDRTDAYETERDRPDLDATSHLSVDLHFGAISPREVVRSVGRRTKGARMFVRQLAWRDWYAHLFHERPELVDHCQQQMYEKIAWRNDPDEIAAWREGRTGYPIVDAAMRELAATGWMHNRLRMIVASFLVKDLLVDWRVGERHFRRLLADGDVAQNAGNWQWCAGTGPDAAPYFRIFNPVAQARRFDPQGDYVRRWVPELARIPGPDVHAPWRLPPLDLAAAGVLLGDTYPALIVDHATARERALGAYARARSPEP